MMSWRILHWFGIFTGAHGLVKLGGMRAFHHYCWKESPTIISHCYYCNIFSNVFHHCYWPLSWSIVKRNIKSTSINCSRSLCSTSWLSTTCFNNQLVKHIFTRLHQSQALSHRPWRSRPFAGQGTSHVSSSNLLVAQLGDAMEVESPTVMGQIPRRRWIWWMLLSSSLRSWSALTWGESQP